MEYKFIEKLETDTPIKWWNECRIELNKIIEKYNNWQIYDKFDYDKSIELLAFINYGKETIGSRNGGSGYLEVLTEMENFVKLKAYKDGSY